MELPGRDGPTLILKGKDPDIEILKEAAALVKRFSKYRDEQSIDVEYWNAGNPNQINRLASVHLDEQDIQTLYI